MSLDASIVNAIYLGTQSSKCKDIVYKNLNRVWRQASVAIILRTDIEFKFTKCDFKTLASITSDPSFTCQLLLCQRANSVRDRHSGQLCLPGGKLDDGETDLEAALRETKEEINLDLTKPGTLYLGRLPVNLKLEDETRKMRLAAHVFLVSGRPELELNLHEIQDFKWIPLAQFTQLEDRIRMHKLSTLYAYLMASEAFIRYPWLYKAIARNFEFGFMPVVDMGMGHPLMGFTHFLLAQFFELAFYMDRRIAVRWPDLKVIVQATKIYYLEFRKDSLIGRFANLQFNKQFRRNQVEGRIQVGRFIEKL